MSSHRNDPNTTDEIAPSSSSVPSTAGAPSSWSLLGRRDSMEDITFTHTTTTIAPPPNLNYPAFFPLYMTALPGTMPYFPPHSLHESATTTLLQQPWNYVPSMTTTFPPSPSSSSYSSASSPYPSTRSSSFSDEYRMSPASSSPAAVPLFHPRGTMYTPVPWAFPDVERSGEMTSGDISSPPSFSLASSQDSLYSSGGHISSPSTSPLSQSLVIKRSPSAASSPEREISPATNNPPPQLRPAPSARTSTIVSPNDEDKTEPYAQIIYRALMSVPDHKMILADIYKYFQQHRPRRASRDGGWKNSIRHNLSMNGAFIKEPRPSNDSAKRFIWVLSKHAQIYGISSTTRYRRNAPRARSATRKTSGGSSGGRSTRNGRKPVRVVESAADPTMTVSLSRPDEEPLTDSDADISSQHAYAYTPPDSPAPSFPLPTSHAPNSHEQRFTFSAETEEQLQAIKLEKPSSPIISMEDHSPHVPEPSNDFEDVEFREDAMYIRYGQFGTWHEVQYTDTFSEQYDLVKPETGLE